jgi:hypothetical protein
LHNPDSSPQRWNRVQHVLADRRTTWLLLAAVLLLYVVWSVMQYQRNKLYDFNTYYLAAIGLRNGYDIYDMVRELDRDPVRWRALAEFAGVPEYAVPYLYPPLTAQVVLPLTALDYRTAGLIWTLLSGAAMIGAMYLIGATSRRTYGPSLALLLLLVSVPALTTLYAGQVNGFVLLALAIAIAGLQWRNAWWAGIGVAVAAMLKVTPIVLVGYLLWRRQWKAAVVAIAAGILLLVATLATFPPLTLASYAANFLRTSRPGELFLYPPNQGINGVLGRLLTGLMADAAIYQLYLLVAALMVGLTIVLLWPPDSLAGDWPFEVGMVLSAISLITPYVWYHHLVVLLIPLFFVTTWVVESRQSGVLVLLTVLLILSSLHGLAWRSLSNWTPLTAFPFALTIGLYVLQAHIRNTLTDAGNSSQ